MPIEFRCPQCDKLLRVPDESAGAKAKCPQCGNISDVPRSEEREGGETTNLESTDLGTQSKNEDANPYSASVPPNSPSKPSLPTEICPTRADFGDVFRLAWDVWKSNLGLLFGLSFVVVTFDGVTDVLERGLADDGQFVAWLVVFVISFLVETFLGIGYTQAMLKLLRGQSATFGDLFGGGPLYGSVLGATALFTIAAFVGFIVCIIPAVLLVIFFWPFHTLIVDHKAKAIESFGIAYQIAKENVGTTILMILSSIGLIIVGVLVCLVGLFFTVPLMSLMWTAAYLTMSGQVSAKSPGLDV